MAATQRILGFDYGLAQIGVALLQRPLNIVTPLAVISCKNKQPNWPAIAAVIEEWQARICIIGYPLSMDGTDNQMSRRAEKFSRQLNGRFGVFTELHDERLSSHSAKALAKEMGYSGNYSRQPLDSLAATLILKQWLAEQEKSGK